MSTTKFSHTLGQAGEQSVNNDNLHVIFRYIYFEHPFCSVVCQEEQNFAFKLNLSYLAIAHDQFLHISIPIRHDQDVLDL